MLFNSIEFALFFVVVMAVFYILPSRIRAWWILAASLFFYCYDTSTHAFNEQSVFLFIAIGVSYISAVIMDLIPSKGRLKVLRVILLLEGIEYSKTGIL